MTPTIGSIVKLLFASGEYVYLTLTDFMSFSDGTLGFSGNFRHGGEQHTGSVEMWRIKWNGRFFEANMS
ncbi:MAG: hypothetical protein E7L01_09670 [Paenibacillus macerans]|uniref:hypothetical protein n=1 Tax=Paenibacillus macerans TaxID=44252 RepID=UPI001F0E9AEE|nr:hypothetical protein [Paenibacillus macerans]MDU5947302.1 hypothetical protein [Paenibacillus macerans]MDU7473593.1 hypothetical protein [Paenibacillus macerans]MEC0139177.1 hypothetical protein [Paenibacillus macerans]UMV47258.1 hypothetical protein LMZ02_28030 [Paenibacillus macerans]